MKKKLKPMDSCRVMPLHIPCGCAGFPSFSPSTFALISPTLWIFYIHVFINFRLQWVVYLTYIWEHSFTVSTVTSKTSQPIQKTQYYVNQYWVNRNKVVFVQKKEEKRRRLRTNKQTDKEGEVRPQEGAKTVASTPYSSKPVQHNWGKFLPMGKGLCLN